MQVETKYSIGDVIYRGRVDNGRVVVAHGPYTISGAVITVKPQDGKEAQHTFYSLVGYNESVPEENMFTSGSAAFKHYEKELNKDKE